jgi:lysophospholipase L1-like esterase
MVAALALGACYDRDIVIGDSIAEGHPMLHGPRHATVSVLPGQDRSLPGQLSYEISPTEPWANMGVGGQTSSEVRRRWRRDTLNASRIYLHIGINDLARGEPGLRDNVLAFAADCRRRHVQLLLSNIGPDNEPWFNETKQAEAIAYNRWLVTDFRNAYPEVVVVDYLDWATGGTNDLRGPLPQFFADAVHPNPAGYHAYAQVIRTHLSQMTKTARLDEANTR